MLQLEDDLEEKGQAGYSFKMGKQVKWQALQCIPKISKNSFEFTLFLSMVSPLVT